VTDSHFDNLDVYRNRQLREHGIRRFGKRQLRAGVDKLEFAFKELAFAERFDRRACLVCLDFGNIDVREFRAQLLAYFECRSGSVGFNVFIRSFQSCQSNRSQGGHSADVRIRLLFKRKRNSRGSLGPDFLLVDNPNDHPPCDATLEMRR